MGSQTRRLRALGLGEPTPARRARARDHREIGLKARKRARDSQLKFVLPSPSSFDLFERQIAEANQAMRGLLLADPFGRNPVFMMPRSAELVVLEASVPPRNEPAECLQALFDDNPKLMSVAMQSFLPIPGIAELARAAAEREEQILRERYALAAGATPEEARRMSR